MLMLFFFLLLGFVVQHANSTRILCTVGGRGKQRARDTLRNGTCTRERGIKLIL